MPPVRTVRIRVCQSDGDSTKWPAAGLERIREDDPILVLVGNLWAKSLSEAELGAPRAQYSWKLDQFPAGYAGFSKARTSGSGKSLDRYTYGHPSGKAFDSTVQFYVHFKHLMDSGGAVGCPCVLCSGNKVRTSIGGARSSSSAAANPARGGAASSKRTQYTKKTGGPSSLATSPGISTDATMLLQGRLRSASPPSSKRRKMDYSKVQHKDEEGVPNFLKNQLIQLVERGEGTVINKNIDEPESPDWLAGSIALLQSLRLQKCYPQHAPRLGELVMYVRRHKAEEIIAWDPKMDTTGNWCLFNVATQQWADRPRWEAGVITEIPNVTAVQSPADEGGGHTTVLVPKSDSMVDNAYKIQVLSEPGNAKRHIIRQYCYVQLEATRPLALWQQCLANTARPTDEQSLRHALTTCASMNLVSRYRFTGTYPQDSSPEASMFCRGVYIGAELILQGDAVRLCPFDQPANVVTDILIVKTILFKAYIANGRDKENPTSAAWNYSLHVRGPIYTLDPARSYTGTAWDPLLADSPLLPKGVADFGTFYHKYDPKNDTYSEIPFSYILGKVYEYDKMQQWFSPPAAMSAVSRPVKVALITGLAATQAARAYAKQHDPRILPDKSWFWANSRTEGLDLWEVNGKWVGVKDANRAGMLQAFQRSMRAAPSSRPEYIPSNLGRFAGMPEPSAGPSNAHRRAETDNPNIDPMLKAVSMPGEGRAGKVGVLYGSDENNQDVEMADEVIELSD